MVCSYPGSRGFLFSSFLNKRKAKKKSNIKKVKTEKGEEKGEEKKDNLEPRPKPAIM